MTTIFASHEFEMDVSHLDDKMELATSPHPHVDDIDFDFDPIRQNSVDRSMADDTENTANNAETMQSDTYGIYNDDNMLDDENLQQYDENGDELEDLNMESYDQDEEILYDEEVGSIDMIEPQSHENLVESSIQPTNEDLQPESASDQEATNEHSNITDSTTNPSSQPGQQADPQKNTMNNFEIQQGPITEHDKLGAATERVDFALQEDKDLDSRLAEQVRDEIPDEVQKTFESTPQQADGQDQQHQSTELHTASDPQSTAHVEEEVVERTDDVETRTKEDARDGSLQPLHPVTVFYMDQEMSLFPPMIDDSSATFFLSEPSLAYGPMEQLLSSCREILGETLEHDDELVLDIPSLGLHICEDSKYATQITLSQVIDIYLALSRNEHTDSIEPLSCTLSSRVCLASQYAYLAGCASEGKTFSEVAADYVDSPFPEDGSLKEVLEDDQVENNEEATGEVSIHDDSVLESADYQSGDANLSEDAVGAPNEPLEHADEVDEPSTEADIEAEAIILPATAAEQSITDVTDTNSTLQGNVGESQVIAQSGASTSTIETQPASEKDRQTYGTPGQAQVHEVDNFTGPEDHESVSSHTVDGEPAEVVDENVNSSIDHTDDGNIEEAEEVSMPEPHEEIEDITDGLFDDDLEVTEPQVEDHTRIDDVETEEGAETLDGDVADQTSFDAKGDFNHVTAPLDDTTPTGEDESYQIGDELDFLLPGDEVAIEAPITPSKQNASKRKAADAEEDFDFLDLSTPEPKRTRAS